jgi:PiT family inorganic phosphate transporter
MDLSSFNKVENAAGTARLENYRLAISLIFIVGIMMYVSLITPDVPGQMMLVIAAMMGGYMALNIGANDVANNVGPAVGSKALTLVGAIILAAIFEAAGAIIAGGSVVGTIKKGIIDPALIANGDVFVWLMMAALLAGALWLNIATYLGAPVSTTHSIVGGVLGAGIAAGGWEIANWATLGKIAASWVISPLLGALIAAAFLYLIKRTITYQSNMIMAARKIVPVLISLMAWVFSTYLILKGLKKIWKVEFPMALLVGGIISVIIYLIVKPIISRKADSLNDTKQAVNSLFTTPLIFSAALLSFAHGANDVANAVGPLAAVSDAIQTHGVNIKAAIPLWVLMIGAIGIALGLALYGPKLIKTVGSEITELDKMRAFCVAMAAAITVIIASQLGLPVSSTHIAVGGVFGVGFLREFLKKSHAKMINNIIDHHEGEDQQTIEKFLAEFQKAKLEEKRLMLKRLKKNKTDANLTKKERKSLRRVYNEELVKRSAMLKIAAAWVITVPVSALLAALIYFTIRGIMLP